MDLELGSLKSVRAFAAAYIAKGYPLHGSAACALAPATAGIRVVCWPASRGVRCVVPGRLINNAGIMMTGYRKTEDGPLAAVRACTAETHGRNSLCAWLRPLQVSMFKWARTISVIFCLPICCCPSSGHPPCPGSSAFRPTDTDCSAYGSTAFAFCSPEGRRGYWEEGSRADGWQWSKDPLLVCCVSGDVATAVQGEQIKWDRLANGTSEADYSKTIAYQQRHPRVATRPLYGVDCTFVCALGGRAALLRVICCVAWLSKLANVLLAKELTRREKANGVTAYSLHPGWLHAARRACNAGRRQLG